MKRIMRWIASFALIATPWIAAAQSTFNSSTTIGGLGTTTSTVSSPATLSLPTDTAVIMPAASEPAFDAFEATLGLAGASDFNSFAAKLGIGASALATLPALTSLGTTGSTSTTDSQTLVATSSSLIGPTLSTIGAASTPSIGGSTSSPSSLPAVGTSTQSALGQPAVRTLGTPASTMSRARPMPATGGRTSSSSGGAPASVGTQTMSANGAFPAGAAGRSFLRSSTPNSARAITTGSSGGGAAPATAGSARGGTVFDEPCQPEEVLCIEIR